MEHPGCPGLRVFEATAEAATAGDFDMVTGVSGGFGDRVSASVEVKLAWIIASHHGGPVE